MMTQDKKSTYTRLTVALVILFFIVAVFAGILGLLVGGDVPAGPAGTEMTESPFVSHGESAPPVSSAEQPQPGAPTIDEYRSIWLTEADLAGFNSADELISPAADTGFTAVIMDVSAQTDRELISEIAQFSSTLGLYFQINITYVPDSIDDVTDVLTASGETFMVFFPYNCDADMLSQVKRMLDDSNSHTKLGVVSTGNPENGLNSEVEYVCVCPENADAESVIKAWSDEISGTGIPMIVGLTVDPEEAENDPEYLVNMQKYAVNAVNYRGTAVRGTEKMYIDTTGAVTALIAFLNGEDIDVITGEFAIVEPTETNYSTYGEIFTLRGTANPIYELKVNGEAVEIPDNGVFTWICELEAGENIITVSYKGESVVFTVDRKIDVIKSISPSEKTYANGGVTLTLTAEARADSRVIATINGQEIILLQEEEFEGESSDGEYARFSGLYKLPDATADVQDLGRVTFKGTVDGFTESVIGGRVYINPILEDEPDGETISTIKVTASHTEGENFTKTYNPNYLDDNSDPTKYFLATGMVDEIVGETVATGDNGSYECYILSSGVMIHKEDCSLIEREKIKNNISSASMSEEGKYTVIRFRGSEPVAVIPTLDPVNFTGKHSLGYSINEFKATQVVLLFSNTVAVSDILGFSGNDLFSSYKWEKVDNGYRLVLKFKKAGAFYGIKMEVDSSGRTVISFKNPIALKKANNKYGYSLDGVKVVLDAGHNGNYPYNPGAAGFVSGLHECNLNLFLAEKTKERLEALGADVLMTRTDNASDMTSDQRVEKIITSNADLCIAIHHNGSGNTSAYGTSAYYFYPFAKDFSESIYNRMVDMYQENIYTSGSKKTGCAAGCKYYPYYMTRVQEFPCILVEAGYISNRTEYDYLIRDDIQDLIADAFTAGIIDYLSSQS